MERTGVILENNKSVPIIYVALSLDIGGLERIIVDLVKKLDKNKFKPIVCCLCKKGVLANEIEKFGIDVIELEKKRGIDYYATIKLARILREKRIQIIHSHNINAHIHSFLAAKIANTPIIITTKHGAGLPFKNSLSKMLWTKSINLFTDRIVTVSEDIKNILLNDGNINPNKITTIINGINIENYSREIDTRKKKREIGISDEDLIIGNVARLSREKGHNILLEAFSIVLKEVSNARLVLVGDGPLRKNLEDKAKELGIINKINFLGFRHDINELLKIFDVFVLPSITEGISLALLEAMSAGLPIVATNVGGNPEIVIDGQTGLLVPPNDPYSMSKAILKVMDDKNFAKQMGLAGKALAQKQFSIEAMVSQYEQLYQNILNFKNDLIRPKRLKI